VDVDSALRHPQLGLSLVKGRAYNLGLSNFPRFAPIILIIIIYLMDRLSLLSSQITTQQQKKLLELELKDNGVALVKMLPNAGKYIVLNNKLVAELNTILEQLEGTDSVKVVVLTGTKDSFATGADIKILNDTPPKSMLLEDYFERTWARVLPKFKKPLIVLVQGFCFGGGFEVALCGDIMVASKAQFGLPEIKLGLIPGSGGTQRLAKIVGKSKAMHMVLTGDKVDEQEALKLGIISQIVSQEKALEETLEIAVKIAQHSQIASAYAKKAVNSAFEVGLSQGLDIERNLFTATYNSEDKVEGVKAFLEKRKPQFKDR